jgi:hypothetical protein
MPSKNPCIIIGVPSGYNVTQGIVDFYSQGFEQVTGRRWSRLQTAPFWIYLDIHAKFTDWDSTWEAGRRSLNEQSEVTSVLCLLLLCQH